MQFGVVPVLQDEAVCTEVDLSNQQAGVGSFEVFLVDSDIQDGLVATGDLQTE